MVNEKPYSLRFNIKGTVSLKLKNILETSNNENKLKVVST